MISTTLFGDQNKIILSHLISHRLVLTQVLFHNKSKDQIGFVRKSAEYVSKTV